MDALEEFDLQCPNCGEECPESLSTAVLNSRYTLRIVRYVCRPMLLSVVYSDEIQVSRSFATREDD